MKDIVYKEIVEIDGRQHTITTCHYSDTIAELVADEIIEDDNQAIIDCIIDDIVNHSDVIKGLACDVLQEFSC